MDSRLDILVTGSNGQLGSEIRKLEPNYPYYKFSFTNSEQLDVTNFIEVESFIRTNKINIIINCAAYTDVNKAEIEIEKANAVNHLAVANLAIIAKSKNIKLVHFSTDYVFDGRSSRPYSEEDSTNPQNVYGETKLKGEKAIQEIDPKNSIIIRTSWLYSQYGNNFVKTMLRLGNEGNEIKVVADQIGSPTFGGDLAKVLLDILPEIENENLEIYHYSNEGCCSWYDFAKCIFLFKDLDINVKPIKTQQLQTMVNRPLYTVMDNSKFKKNFKIQIPYWQDSLKQSLGFIEYRTEY
jgi:dTDP-4-dehydrorhamnose reductase